MDSRAHAAIRALPLLVFVLAAMLPSTPARADDATRCRERVSLESARFAQTVMKALTGCEEYLVKGKTLGPCPDPIATARIAKAESQLQSRIAKTCGGTTRTCGGIDDVPLADYGWDVGTCPDIENAGCADTVDDCDDVSECLRCVGDVAVGRLVGLYADDFVPSVPNSALNTCQVRIVKESLRLFRTHSKVLQKCWRGVSRERFPGPCPDPGDGKALAKMERVVVKFETNVCRGCGGADGACGGLDDFDAATIGFAAACPDVTPPGAAASCGGPITTLQEIVDCVVCLNGFESACHDALSVPWAESYPAVCSE